MSPSPSIANFVEAAGIVPDRFQIEAFEAFDAGAHVIVAAPTGAGKTLVASYAIDRCLSRDERVFYTTPIKALSNQKYGELVAVYGRDRVGLLTGDNVINGDADVVVMTTEVLRNMLYAGRTLDALAAVVLDEVHYLQDSYRGPVWEEVIIHLPHRIQLVALSATVSNADELAEWMQTVRGPTTLVIETRRPVELENRYLVGERGSATLHFFPTLVQGRPNARGFRFDPEPRRSRNGKGPHGPKGRPRPKWQTPRRADVVQLLRERSLLPAIYFLFSRAACAEAAQALADSGVVLTSAFERGEIRALVAERMANVGAADRDVLGYERFLRALEVGVAPHHAGMVPPMKEAVEACFERGLVKVVFATETLALGINMPARTVVIEKLTKWTGDRHDFLTPAQFTQLTGRAGRRGIDEHGDAIVLWSPWVRFEQVADLVASREYALRSAFRPTYNMAANLVRRYDPERARHLLNLSFAQFRADADVVRSEHQLERLRQRQRQIAHRLEREFGPLDDLREALSHESILAADPTEIAAALSRLRPGDVIDVVAPGVAPRVVVLAVAYRKGGRIKVLVSDEHTELTELTVPDLEQVPTVVGSVPVVEPYLPHSITFAHEMSRALAQGSFASGSGRSRGAVRVAADVGGTARKGLRRLDRLEAEMIALRRDVNSRAESLGLQFDRVIELLGERGHLEGWELTDSGRRLARMYHELDLFVVEALEAGLFDELSAAEVAALASCFIFEERRSGAVSAPWFPSPALRGRFDQLCALQADLVAHERAKRLNETREPDAGFMAPAHAWAAGGRLDDVLEHEELTAGDFVRTARLLIDLLRQIAELAARPDTAGAARAAAAAIHRDLVAVSSAAIAEATGDDEPDTAAEARADDEPDTAGPALADRPPQR